LYRECEDQGGRIRRAEIVDFGGSYDEFLEREGRELARK
jgi:hypothetical protein